MDTVRDYIELVKAPWGKMFYDLLFMQLNIPQTTRLNILDFGSGLGVTANHYAAWHDVVAVEPNPEMIVSDFRNNEYKQINGGINELADFTSGSFDFIFCHNVLEYVEDKKPIIAELLRLIKLDGTLSIVKHNRAGRVFGAAVFGNDPKKALSLLVSGANDKSNYLGTQYIYSNTELAKWLEDNNGKINNIYGMRAFYALGQDNTVKYTDEWYMNMLELESKAAVVNEYKQAAFHNHILIGKVGEI